MFKYLKLIKMDDVTPLQFRNDLKSKNISSIKKKVHTEGSVNSALNNNDEELIDEISDKIGENIANNKAGFSKNI